MVLKKAKNVKINRMRQVVISKLVSIYFLLDLCLMLSLIFFAMRNAKLENFVCGDYFDVDKMVEGFIKAPMDEVHQYLDKIPVGCRKEVLNLIPLKVLLLRSGAINYYEQTQELERISIELSQLNDDIAYVNNLITRATQLNIDFKEDRKFEFTEKDIELIERIYERRDSEQEQAIEIDFGQRIEVNGNVSYRISPDVAVHICNGASKYASDSAKKLSAEGSKVRAECHTIIETLSSIIKSLTGGVQRIFQSM